MNLFYNACKVLLPLSVILGLLFAPVSGSQAHSESQEEMTDNAIAYISVEDLEDMNIDFDIGDEVLQLNNILDAFAPKDPDGFYVYPNPQEVAAPYIPKEALCTDVCVLGNVVSFDYRIENIRYIASYCFDGSVRLTATVLADEIDYVYEITSDDPDTVMCLDCRDNEVA